MKYLFITFLLLLVTWKTEAKIKNYHTQYFPNAKASLQIKKKGAIFRIRYKDSEKSYIRLNMYMENKKDTVFFHLSDFQFDAESRYSKGYTLPREDKVMIGRTTLFFEYIDNPYLNLDYHPYVKYLKTGDKLILLYVSNDMREFLAGNQIFNYDYKKRVEQMGEKYLDYLYHIHSRRDIVWLENYTDSELFPPELIRVKKFSEDILPESLKNKKEGKKGFKKNKKKFRMPIIQHDRNESIRPSPLS